MFKNSKEAAISVFPYIIELEERSTDESFSLYLAIYNFIISNIPTDGCNISEEINEEYLKIDELVRPFLLSNHFIRKVNNYDNYGVPCVMEDLYKLTDKGVHAKKNEGIDKFEEEQLLKIKNQKLKETDVKTSVIANWISLCALLVSGGALLYSIFSSDSKEIRELNKKIESIEQEIVLVKEKHLEEHKEYVRHIDSLYIEINKIKNK